MKVSVRILVLLAAVLLLVGTALASEDNWSLRIGAEDGPGVTPSSVTIGVSPTGSNGGYTFPAPPSVAIAIADGITPRSSKVLPSASPYPRIWNLCIGGYGMSQTLTIGLSISTMSSTTLPPVTVQGNVPVRYVLRMMDSRGVAGAPMNGTEWQLAVPAIHSTTSFFTLTLPWLGLSTASGTSLLDEGYKMEFVQEAVPEPSSLMAFGLGLSGLLAIRRRR